MGRVCNAKCVFCTQGDEPLAVQRFIPPEEVYKHIDHAAENGYQALAFLGGEVTINKHFVDYVAYGRDKGFRRIDLCTHGAMLHNKAYVDSLVAAGLTRVTVSFHGHTQQIEDTISRREGFFHRKVAGLKNLIAHERAGAFPDGISVNPVVTTSNYRYLPEMAVFFTKLGVRDIRFNAIRPEGQALYNPDVVPTYDMVRPFIEKTILLNERKLKNRITFGDFPFCVMPDAFKLNRRLFFKYTGQFNDLDKEIAIYRSPKHGELSYENFKWDDHKNSHKSFVAACRTCRVAPLCHGVWIDYVGHFGDKEFAPIEHDLAGEHGLKQQSDLKPLTPVGFEPEKTTATGAQALSKRQLAQAKKD